jgi:hypothetical protein
MLLKGKFKEEKVKENIKNYFKYLYKHSEFFTGLADIIPSKEVGCCFTHRNSFMGKNWHFESELC